jgi:hypothetical protein
MPYADYGGDWDQFLRDIYACFQRDFLDEYDRGTLQFDGVRLNFRRHPIVRGKEATFWHLVSTGDIEADRLPDIRRCECLPWARAIIKNPNDPAVRRWENTRNGNTNICLWLVEENYLVVLGKRQGYVLLLTAYLLPDYKRAKLNREYEESQA